MVKIDKELLFLLSENSRLRLKDASIMLKKTPQRLKYSMNIIENEHVIADSCCIFDYSRLGMLLFRVYFKGGYISENDKEGIIKKLSDNPSVVAVYELSGEFDLAIEFESPNPSKFNKELKKIADLIKTLNTYKIVLNVVTHIYPRSYLIRDQQLLMGRPSEIIIGGDRKVESFNENEMKVIGTLIRNPKIRMTSLAKESCMNVRTVKSIIRDLRKREVIMGFSQMIDPNKMEIYKFRVFLKLHNMTQEVDEEMLNFMMQTKEIVVFHKTVGDWDIEIDIESLSKARVRYLIHQMREKFKEFIQNFNMIEFYQFYKRSYLPISLFEQK